MSDKNDPQDLINHLFFLGLPKNCSVIDAMEKLFLPSPVRALLTFPLIVLGCFDFFAGMNIAIGNYYKYFSIWFIE
jgi:hypothetical protein